MIHVYLDDTKVGGNKGFCGLAGYVADENTWDAFNTSWAEVLQRHGLERLHTADFVARRREYSDWSGDSGAVLREFVEVVQTTLTFGVAGGLDRGAFEKIVPRNGKYKPADVFCLERALRYTMDGVRRTFEEGHGHKLSIVIDDDEAVSPAFYKTLRKLKRGVADIRNEVAAITFGNDRFVTPLQASDLLAHATQRGLRTPRETWSECSPFLGLLVPGVLNEYWDREELERRQEEIFKAALWDGAKT